MNRIQGTKAGPDGWRREAWELRGFLGVVLPLVCLLAVGTRARNETWRRSGDLWLDIVRKTAAFRVTDPATGREAPRSERARVYNNLGLYLYNEARDLQQTLAEFLPEVAAYERERGGGAAKRVRSSFGRRPTDRERRILCLYERLQAGRRRLLAHVPPEFAARFQARRERRDDGQLDWDIFQPAELCLRKALFHSPNYFKAHLNLSLVLKFRACREHQRRSPAWREAMARSTDHLYAVCAVVPDYGKGLLYLASNLLMEGDARFCREYALRALACHRPREGRRQLFAKVRLVIAASRRLRDWRTALHWIDLALGMGAPNPGRYRDLRRLVLREMARERRQGAGGGNTLRR